MHYSEQELPIESPNVSDTAAQKMAPKDAKKECERLAGERLDARLTLPSGSFVGCSPPIGPDGSGGNVGEG